MPKRLTPRDLIATIKANRLSFSQFESQLEKAEGSTYRLKGLRGWRFSRQAVAKAREFLFPQVERQYTKAALKGQSAAERWLKKHGFTGAKRSSLFKRLTKTLPGGQPIHPHRAVQRSPVTGRLEPAQLKSYRHYVLTKDRGWRFVEVAGDNLLHLQRYRQAYDHAIGLRKEPPSMPLERFRDIDIRDVHGNKIRVEIDVNRIREDWARKTASQRRSINKKRHYPIRQRHSIPTRSARGSKRGERRARGR